MIHSWDYFEDSVLLLGSNDLLLGFNNSILGFKHSILGFIVSLGL